MRTNGPMPILCGTDFSENAGHAADAAATLAVRLGVPLVLVHADDMPMVEGVRQEAYEARLAALSARLWTEAEHLRRLGTTVEETLSTGEAGPSLVRLAAQRQARLLVVSSLSKSAPERWLLGSVAEHTAQSSPVPTLVVRDAAPFEVWARGTRALKVFVAVDFTGVSDAPLGWVSDLRKIGPCEITVANVDSPLEERERLGVGSRPFTENSPTVQRVIERDLREKVRALLGDGQVRVLVEPFVDRPDARLIELAEEAKADVIVVGTHQRQGLSRLGHHSVSRGILRHARMNVVCVPPSAVEPEVARIPQIQRVLVATDFSELGDRAVPHAYSLMREGGTVFLIHVMHPMRLPNPLTLDPGPNMDAALAEHTARVRESAARLRALIPSESEKRGVASRIEVVEHREPKNIPHVGMSYGIGGEAHLIKSTDPALAICQAAERIGADVICLGSHGRTGLAAAFMGSVAQAVMAQSPRPVLIMRLPAK